MKLEIRCVHKFILYTHVDGSCFYSYTLLFRLYDLSILCAEVASHIGNLNSEWLGVLKALCCTSMHGLGFDDLQETIDVRLMLSFNDELNR